MDSAAARVVRATAPVRICDVGGWTDTWFAKYGCVFNVAVDPGVTVEVEGASGGDSLIRLSSDQLGNASLRFGEPVMKEELRLPVRIIEEIMGTFQGTLCIRIRSGVPSGSAMGTSASVSVALVASLSAVAGMPLSQEDAARRAQHIESSILQTGVQDQIAAAIGGINSIEIVDYPAALIERLDPGVEIVEELERRLLVFYLGAAHTSSVVHDRVIARLQGKQPACGELQALRDAAVEAREAFMAGDFRRLGIAMSENTLAQAALHPDLISKHALTAIRAAASAGAVGWKVNGAGGEGGSLTILAPAGAHARSAIVEAVESAVGGVKNIPVTLNRTGVVVR